MFVEKSGKKFLLLLLVVFSFVYRFLLMTRNIYPPGADIGLHESVIQTITSSETTDFLSINYHMGGGVSVTNPGYHLFTALVAAFTGAPDYLVHVMVSSFFSAVMVLVVYIMVRSLWNEEASLIAAFLTIFSAGDISMLCWGGYPNVTTLFLIPVVFILFLNRSKFSRLPALFVASLFVGAIFLTHVFSGFVFLAITLLAMFGCALFHKRTKISKQQAISWISPIVFGVLLVSPYLFSVVPIYFSSDATVTGAVLDTKENLLATDLIPGYAVILSLVPFFGYFLLSKFFKGKYLTASSVLFAFWLLLPVVMTQSRSFGVYLDYERFNYFLFFPLTAFISLATVCCARILLQKTSRFINKVSSRFLVHKIVYSVLVLVVVLFSVFYTPFYTTPDEALVELTFYQTMSEPGYEAIQWIKNNTPADSVLVSDAEFGWWLSGFAQRPTLSAVKPKFLVLAREIEPAAVARNLLHSDYLVDNGVIQVVYNDSPVEGNNFEVSTKLAGSFDYYQFMSIKDTQISLLYRNNNTARHLDFDELPITDLEFKNGSNWATFQITMENRLLVFSESVTIYTGVKFAKVSMSLESKLDGIVFDWINVPFMSAGAPTQTGNSIAFVDSSINAVNQLIFPHGELGNRIVLQENPETYDLVASLNGKTQHQIDFFVGFCPIPDSTDISGNDFNGFIEQNALTYFDSVSNLPLTYFDYKAAVNAWNISYVVVTFDEAVPRFVADPMFSLAYKNEKVAIFRVNPNS